MQIASFILVNDRAFRLFEDQLEQALRQAQADEYANRIGIGLDAGVSAFVFWGFTDRHTWVPSFTKGEYDEPLPFDRECRPKPAHAAIRRALAG